MLPRTRRRTWFASGLTGVLTAGAVFALVAGSTVGSATPARAIESTDTSAVTVTAKEQDPNYANAPMPDLAVTVSQTKQVVSQGIRVSWTGGKKSTAPSPGGNGGENFLQIFMCWGDDPSNPHRPDRTTCEYGGTGAVGASRYAYRNFALRDIPAEDLPYSAPSAVSFLPPYTAVPFVARNGKRIDGIKKDPVTGSNSIDYDVDINNNQFFTSYTTNEIPWAGSGNDGRGAVVFEAQTAVQSDGLGCGSPQVTNGEIVGASCWLVILPRGSTDNGSVNITQSGLFIDSWRHALSVKLGFEPVGSRCPIGQAERQISGSELAALAVNAWQPAMCSQKDGSVYALLTGAESDAVRASASSDDAPLALTSYPLAGEAKDPLLYAPVALTGAAISIAIDRLPNPSDKSIPAEYADRARSPFTSINLTPRLLAKLLSYSYRSALPTGADKSYLIGTNPFNITEDPDFLAVNDPEWKAQALSGPAIADIIVPQGRSDTARAVWAYIAADTEARDFLASKPDPWGMIVNPWYSTDAGINLTGAAFELDREDFPKADPVEIVPKNQGPLNLVTWRPYSNDLGSVASLVLRGDGLVPGVWDPTAVPARYGKSTRMLPGNQAMVGLTSASAASRYQIVTASLRNPAGAFVSPSTSAMQAAASVMVPMNDAGSVSGFDPTSAVSAGSRDAYPLTLAIYAATNPQTTGADLRGSYAGFIRYAVSPSGQTPGVDVGQLPGGYAPLPKSWVDRANAAAEAVERGPVPTASAASASTTDASARPAAAQAPDPAVVTTSAQADQAGSTTPVSTGRKAAALSGGATPEDPSLAGIAIAVPASLLAGAVGACAVPLIPRLRRRGS